MKLDSLVPHLYTNMSIDSVGMFVALNWAQRQNGMELMSIGVEITSARRWVFTHILCHLALAPSTNFRRLLHIDWEFLQKVICTNWPNWQVLSAYLFISPLLLKGGTTNRVNEGSAGRSEESRRNCVLLLGKVLRRSRSRAALTSSSSSGISTQPKVSRERERKRSYGAEKCRVLKVLLRRGNEEHVLAYLRLQQDRPLVVLTQARHHY